MSRVHFVGGEKGGVGKSALARLLCQWFIDQSAKISALDADPSQGALLLSYPEHGHAIDLEVFESIDRIMDRALGAEREVIVDLPAHSHRALIRWLEEGDVLNLAKETGVQLLFWQVTDGGFDSVRAMENTLPALTPEAEVVIVCNRRWSEDFSHLTSSPVLQQLLAQNARLMELPKLDPRAMYRMEQQRLGLGKALSSELTEDEGGLTTMEQRRVALWLKQAYEHLGEILLPEPLLDMGASLDTGLSANALTNEDAPANDEAPAHEDAPSPLLEASSDLAKIAPLAEEAPIAVAETAATEGSDAEEVILPTTPLAAPGSKKIDGARTWTEVGDTYQIHHVRYP